MSLQHTNSFLKVLKNWKNINGISHLDKLMNTNGWYTYMYIFEANCEVIDRENSANFLSISD